MMLDQIRKRGETGAFLSASSPAPAAIRPGRLPPLGSSDRHGNGAQVSLQSALADEMAKRRKLVGPKADDDDDEWN
ncbi:hypothetical protein T492DRAFT_919097 [Pavlovales sp. CCMP2436]|nr:hypothetical protein T492DRAFT_919097 [Pavlovales sp. CCMP2436]